jgi:uncharacterized membrane protein YwzB
LQDRSAADSYALAAAMLLQSSPARGSMAASSMRGISMISALINVLIIIVIGAICFWAIDKFIKDRRLEQLLKLLVVLICALAILRTVLAVLGIYFL